MRLSNVRLLVTRFSRCFGFYRDVMGFEVVFGDEDGPYAEFRAGDDGLIGLFDRVVWAQSNDEIVVPWDIERFDRTTLILEVDDVDGALKQFEDRGARVAYRPKDRPDWGIRTAHLRDPDGQLIELASPLDRKEAS